MEGWPFGLMASSEVRGRYEVLKQIGEGGFGNVYKARRRDDKVVVALKEVHHAQSSRRELDALLRLSHPNVVKLLDYVQQGSSVVLVLEYVESNLAEVIAAGSLEESAIKGIMVQVLRGLAACHSSMLVHRDLKPSNILVTANGVLKIADFGNARVIQERDLNFSAEKEPERSVAGSELLGSLKSCVYGGLVAEGMPGDASCFVDIRQELNPRTRDDSRVGEETSMLRGEALFVQNSNHFHPQERTAGLPGRGFQPSARTKGQEVVNGAVGRKGAISQKQSDFFHKLKGFLKKGSPHSEKQEKVADLQGPVAESPPDGVDNEYRQRSGRWLSPVNSALLVFDNKENQGQCVPSLIQSSSLVVNEGEKVESLSGRLQSLDKDLKVPGDRGCQLGQHGSHMSDGRLDDKICSKVKPHLKQAEGMERDVPQKHFGSTISQLQTHAAEAAAELALVDCSDQPSNVERQAKLRGSAASLMTNNQLMSPEVLVSSAEPDVLTMRVVGDLNSLEDHGECLGVVEPNILPPSSLFKDSASNVSTSSLLASKGRNAYLPASQSSGHNLSVPSEDELRTVDKLPEHQSDKGGGTKLRGSCCFGMGSCGNKGALDSGRVHSENEGSSEPTSTAEVTYDLTRGQKLSQSCQQPKNKLVSCGVGFLRENSACSLPRTEVGIQIVGFEPTQRRDNAPANAYKTTEFAPTVEAFAGAASGMKGIVQPASTTCGLRHHGEPGIKGTRYASPLGAVTGSGNQSLSPVHIGSSGSDDKKSVEDGGSFSLENWDQSVFEARRNLEQGGGVYGLYHNRRGWQGYNSELKCWGVITSKGKIIGQSLSREMTSRAPRIRGASENARLATDKDGQRLFFSESQSLVEWDATRKKSPEMGPLSSSERVEKCRTVVPHQNLREPASELRAKQPKGEVGSSSSTSQCTLLIPPKRVLKSMSSNGGGGVQGGTGWISPSGRFDFLSPAAVGYENEEESSNAEFYYPGRLDMEARNGSDWGSPSEPFDFMRVRTVGDQSGSKSSLSDVSNTDGTEFGLQLTADSSLKHWSDVEKESESGQDGWEKASGEWSTDRDGLMGDLEGPHSGSLARSEETRWFGAPELRDSYLEVDGGRSVRGLAGEQGWDEMHQDSPLQLASQGKDASSEAAIQVPANLEKAWVDSARASGRHAEEPRMGLSDDSTSRSGSEDDGDLTNCVGTRWYRAPELLYGATEYGRAVDLWSVGLIFAELLMGAPLFPGLNDIDQLSRVVRFLGSPTESNWPGVSKLPDYDKIFFQDNRPPLSLHDKFPTASKACLSFLEKFLVYNPAARVNAHEALKDDFFTVSPVPAPPHELKLPTRQRKKSNPQQCGEWSEPLSSSSDFELIS